MKVGLLECDHVLDKFQNIAGDYREMFSALFAHYAPDIEVQSFDIRNGEFPPQLDACDAFITTGSRFSVYDDIAWVHALKDFVRQVRDARKAFVGICFGHQMMAEAMGGRVAKSPYGWGVGAHANEIVRQEAWMTPALPSIRLQFMHQDQVERMPEGGVLLASSDHCPVAMFRVSETMLGIQAHPEFPTAYSKALMLDRVERIGAERIAEGRESLSQPTDEAVIVQWIVRFVQSTLLPN